MPRKSNAGRKKRRETLWDLQKRQVGSNRLAKIKMNKHDVLCGRGNGVATNPGNINFRLIVWQARPAYENAYRQEKRNIAARIVQQISELKPPGRFVCSADSEDNKYFEVPYERSLEKTCQALREKKLKPPSQDQIDAFCSRTTFDYSTLVAPNGEAAPSQEPSEPNGDTISNTREKRVVSSSPAKPNKRAKQSHRQKKSTRTVTSSTPPSTKAKAFAFNTTNTLDSTPEKSTTPRKTGFLPPETPSYVNDDFHDLEFKSQIDKICPKGLSFFPASPEPTPVLKALSTPTNPPSLALCDMSLPFSLEGIPHMPTDMEMDYQVDSLLPPQLTTFMSDIFSEHPPSYYLSRSESDSSTSHEKRCDQMSPTTVVGATVSPPFAAKHSLYLEGDDEAYPPSQLDGAVSAALREWGRKPDMYNSIDI